MIQGYMFMAAMAMCCAPIALAAACAWCVGESRAVSVRWRSTLLDAEERMRRAKVGSVLMVKGPKRG